jgi:hypothetical protein
MKDNDKEVLIKESWQMHTVVENNYLANLAKSGDNNWLEKQRLLLADMALHLLQTALTPGDIALDKLQNNLHAILTITDEFIPDAELKQARDKLYQINKN